MTSSAKPVFKSLIKYITNNAEENDEEEKESIYIEFTDQKKRSENDLNAIDLRWSDVEGENEEILQRLTSFITYKANL